MSTQDRATKCAEELRRTFSIVRLDEDPVHPEETCYHVPNLEEIASILRPFMEQEEGKIEELKRSIDILNAEKLLGFCEECKRKDEEIAKLNSDLEAIVNLLIDRRICLVMTPPGDGTS